MIDANKVDLTTLEQGDTVKKKKGLFFVGLIKPEDDGFFEIILIDENGAVSNEIYSANGTAVRFSVKSIVEIIKNQKRWSDEDMKKAAISGFMNSVYNSEVAENWFAKHR